MSILDKALTSARTISLKKAADAIGNTLGQIADAARATVSNDGAAKADPTNVAYSEARTQAAQELGRINVLVAGNTGVGKSSLINAVFGENVAPTGTGMPVTDTLSLYEAPNSLINLWDSRGFEAGDTEAVKAVDEKLAELRGQGDATA